MKCKQMRNITRVLFSIEWLLYYFRISLYTYTLYTYYSISFIIYTHVNVSQATSIVHWTLAFQISVFNLYINKCFDVTEQQQKNAKEKIIIIIIVLNTTTKSPSQ